MICTVKILICNLNLDLTITLVEGDGDSIYETVENDTLHHEQDSFLQMKLVWSLFYKYTFFSYILGLC